MNWEGFKPHITGKATGQGDQTHVTIKVQAEKQSEILFRIRKDAPLRELMRMYCEKNGLEDTTLRFSFDGMKGKALHTPNDLKLKDGDVVDVWIDQTGGGGRIC